METAWRRVFGQLSIINGEEFERMALHYFRVIWPTMIQAPRLQHLDRFGIDLCVPDADTKFHVVVQAKGFKVDEQLLDSQVNQQILPSIKKFQDSPVTCDQYILLHNRKGDNREAAALIQFFLDQLVLAGKAKSVMLYDLSAFVKEVREKIDIRIRENLKERSLKYLYQQERFFFFGGLYISDVPLQQFDWNLSSVLRQDFEKNEFVDIPAAKLIVSPRTARYTLLIGSFGIGKTTTTLRAAESNEFLVIYVPAYTIVRKYGSQGTNFLMKNINEGLDLLEDLPPDSSEVLGDVIGAALGRILRQPNDQFVLVIDGLDEHIFYGTPHGLQWLTNELAELRCPIVLTTRREHFLSLIGNYELAAENLSKKGGGKRVVNIIQLGAWSSEQAEKLIQNAIDMTSDSGKVKVFKQLLCRLDGDSSNMSRRLLNHPLFLQITLDLIIEGEDWLIDDDDALLEVWARKKIQRDLSVPRLSENIQVDSVFYADRMMLAMSRIASFGQAVSGDESNSDELFEVDRVVKIVNECMGGLSLDISTILTTSLLIPTRKKSGQVLEVKFFHRALQDFFSRYPTN